MNPLPDDVTYSSTLIANVIFVGNPGSGDWILVDAGIRGFDEHIVEAAMERFGASKPKAIVLTHGHFDHVGSLEPLLVRWDVPVFAHVEELPYLTGKEDYPEPDPEVGGGFLSRISPLFPRRGIDISSHVHALPADGSIPGTPEWRWIHTPGHTVGHISLFRERDRTLIAGDAFTTVWEESLIATLLQEKDVHRPPAYFTTDWEAAWASVKKLADLRPLAAITGHGKPMSGEELLQGLDKLAKDFETIAIPENGRYVQHHS